nr:immunoglobulin heavy chain junction region [Mus musculus]
CATYGSRYYYAMDYW